MKIMTVLCLLLLTNGLTHASGGEQTFVVNSTSDESDVLLDGNCNSNPGGPENQCTLRAAIEEANIFAGKTNITFAIDDAGCIDDICTITVDRANLGSLPDIVRQVDIDGSTQPGNSTVCALSPELRPDYKVVLQGDSIDIGLRLEAGSEMSRIRGLNIRNFFNNIAIIKSFNNRIECNLIGTDETGLAGTGQNTANGVIIGCESNDNIIGGPNPEDANVIADHDSDGIQYFADFVCPTATNLPSNNAILGNYIGVAKDGVTPLGNAFSGISFFGGAAFGHFIGTLQDGVTINGNVIGDNESGIYIDDGSNNIVIKGNYLGTDTSGTVDLGNDFGGVDILSGSDNVIGGIAAGEANVIAYNSEGVFISGMTSVGNQVRGNSSVNNLTTAIDIIQNGGIDPDGTNPNDVDDADTGANNLMNHPEITDALWVNFTGDFVVEANVLIDATVSNASYPLVVDMYLDADNTTGTQGSRYVSSNSYTNPQTDDNFIFDLPDEVLGGFIRFTATDAEGNTSEMSPTIQIGIIDLIFKDGFE